MKRSVARRLSLYGAGVVIVLLALAFSQPADGTGKAAHTRTVAESVHPDGFHQELRPGSVNLSETYNISNLTIPADEIHTLLPRDAIPALTDPELQSLSEVDWLAGSDRVVSVTVKGQAVAVPLKLLNWHEIVNLTLGGEPLAVTYCPLCDSATVFNRRIPDPGGVGNRVLEFGVSGALYNSNVLMYDRSDLALWSQLGMRAVSGPMAGIRLELLPIEVVPLSIFRLKHPEGQLVSRDTGHRRDYSRSPYEDYFAREGLIVPIRGVGDQLPMKTLGIGVQVGSSVWFIAADAVLESGYVLDTSAGEVRIEISAEGLRVVSAPERVNSAQTFYYSWSAFYPQTQVIQSKSSLNAVADELSE